MGTLRRNSLGIFILVLLFISQMASGQSTVTANFTHTPDEECADTPILFDASSSTGSGLTYTWDFDDGTPAVTTTYDTISHRFYSFNQTNCGIKERFFVQLTVNDTANNSDNTVRTVTVTPQPLAALLDSLGDDWIICHNPNNPIISDTLWVNDWVPFEHCVNYFNIDWGDGTDTLNLNINSFPIYHVYTGVGTYPLHYYVHGVHDCHWDTTYYVILQTVPTAMLTTNPVDPGCAPYNVEFILSDYENNWHESVYTFDFGDGSPPLVWDSSQMDQYDTIQYTYTQSHCLNPTASSNGYMASLHIDDNGLCGDTTIYSHFIEVFEAPVANFIASTDSLCINEMVCFSNYTTGGFSSGCNQDITYLWDFGDGVASNETEPCHAFINPGIYEVILTAYSSSLCTHDTSMLIRVFDEPRAQFYTDPILCDNDSVHFNDVSIAGSGNVISWLWDFGDGYMSFSQNPVHFYAYPGIFPVYLQVENSKGCSDDTLIFIEVLSSPVAAFVHSAPLCLNDSVYFYDNSYPGLDTITSWWWDFGDGTFSSAQNPTHFYQTSDTFNVTLMVTNANTCASSSSEEIIISEYPVPDFEYAFPCWINNTQFTDLSFNPGIGTITEWIWDFGDGYSAYSQNPYHQFMGTGQYQVNLKVINEHGCSAEITKLVEIFDGPRAEFYTDTVCLDTPVSFADQSTPQNEIVSWYWDFGDPASGMQNNSSQQHPEHIFSIEGYYTVSLTVTDILGCFHTMSHQYYAEPNPIAAFQYMGATCPYGEVSFFDQSQTYFSEINMWVWNFGDGIIDTVFYPENPNRTHVYSDVGTYEASLLVYTVSGCHDVIIDYVFILPGPDADFQYENNCIDQETQFYDLTGANDIVYWEWNFGDPLSGQSNFSTLANPIHEYANIGTYDVTLIVGNAIGCLDTIVKPVTITPLPPVDFYWDGACEDAVTQFFTDAAVVNVNTIIYYLWDFGDGNYANLQNPGHIFDGEGLYNVSLTITDTSSCENTITQEVLVQKKPYAFYDITEPTCNGDSIFFNNLSSSAVGYITRWIWDYDDGSNPDTIYFPDDPNPFHLYDSVGTYSPVLTVTNSKGCSDSYERELIVRLRPEADFVFSYPCEQSPVQFTDLSITNGQGNPSVYSWDFGDPASGVHNKSSMQNPKHTFSHGDSIYNVSLVIENFFQCSDTIAKTIFVNDGPPVDFWWSNACEEAVTYFYPDTSVINMNTVSTWLWDFGDGNFGYTPIAEHIYDGPGTYYVSLTIEDTSVCAGTQSRMLIVKPAPLAAFTVPEVRCENAAILFDDNSYSQQSYITAWHWDFGDGNDTTIIFPGNPDVFHTYSPAGTFEVTLSVISEDSCAASVIEYVEIDSAPLAMFEWDGICDTHDYEFFDLSGIPSGANIMSWDWDFNDPASGMLNTSSLQHPTHNFTEPGVYEVSLNITDFKGCTGFVIIPVTVDGGPPVEFLFTSNCEGVSTEFSIDSALTNIGSIILYEWDFGDGSPTTNQMNPAHVYTVCGTYDVHLTAYDVYGCENVVSHDVYISQGPIALFDYDASCEGESTQFYDHSYDPANGLITNWEWDFGDPASNGSNFSQLQNPVHNFSGSGLFNVTLTVTNINGCSNMTTLPVSIYPKPDAAFTAMVNACDNGTTQFYDGSSSQAQIVSWEWLFENGYHSYTQNPVYTFTTVDSTYAVRLIVTDSRGCIDTLVQEVYVPDELEVAIYEEHDCYGEEMEFMAAILAPLPNSIYSYNWDFGDLASGTANQSQQPQPAHVFTSPGNYYVTLDLVDVNGCGTVLTKEIVIHDLPAPGFSYEVDQCDSIVYFSDMTINNGEEIDCWKWNFGDGSPVMTVFADAGGDVTHAYSDVGEYDVSLTVITANGCRDSIVQPVVREACLIASFMAPGDACQYADVVFSDSSTIDELIQSWTWQFGDDRDTTYFQKCDLLSHSYDQAGEFTVSLIIEANINGFYFSDTMQQSVNVQPAPMVDFLNEGACANEEMTFHNTTQANGASIVSWSWNFGTGLAADTSDLSQPAFTYGTPGLYEVNLLAVNAYGCSNSKTHDIEILTLPTAAFEHSLPCAGDPVRFTDLSEAWESEIVSWNWKFGLSGGVGDSSLVQDPDWTFDIIGPNTVALMVENAVGCRDILQKTIDVYPSPLAAFTIMEDYQDHQGAILIENFAEGAEAYEWHLGDGSSLMEYYNSIEHTFEQEGLYTIMQIVRNEYGCVDTLSRDYDFQFKSLYIPNALIPTGVNPETRVFQPKGRNLLYYHIGVYNTWGEMLWESTALDADGSPTEAWDGRYEGKLVHPDVYVWKAEAMFRDGSIWEGDAVGNTDNIPKSTSGPIVVVR
ncbi:MAG: PKD domain-containing protein [Bacteroidota bacterium]